MACEMNLQIEWVGLKRRLRSVERKETLAVEGEIHLDIRMLPILEEAAMLQVLKEVLKERGWREQEDGSLTKEIGAAIAVLPPEGKTVTLRQKREKEISATSGVSRDLSLDEKTAEKVARQEADRKLSEQKKKERAKLEEEIMRQLAALEPELKAEMQAALNQTYRRALEARAREMGELESLQESGDPGGSYEVTITVRG